MTRRVELKPEPLGNNFIFTYYRSCKARNMDLEGAGAHEPLLRIGDLWKTFGQTIALRDVHFELQRGEVRGLVGPNGAGKSVFSKILAGIMQPDKGTIIWKGKEATFRNVQEARKAGISIVEQEETLVPELDAADNLFLGLYDKRIINRKKLLEEAKKLIYEKFEIPINTSIPVKKLDPIERKIVEISRALIGRSDLIIFDESTAHLSEAEKLRLYQIINELSKQGISIIFISHTLAEVLKVSHTITVFRDGVNVGTLKAEEATIPRLEQMMFGEVRKYSASKRVSGSALGRTPLLSVKNLIGVRVNGVSLDLYEGEIVGITGLRNQGQRELLLTIYGFLPRKRGEILIQGRKVSIKSPKDALRNGIIYITDKREEEGLFPLLPVMRNLSLAILDDLSSFKFFVEHKRERSLAEELVRKFRIKIGSLAQAVINLSGGNKQKVLFARMFAVKPKIALLSYPTIGIDLNVRNEIYRFLDELKSQGLGILIYTDDYEELLQLCDRVMLMHEGVIKATYDTRELDLNKIYQIVRA